MFCPNCSYNNPPGLRYCRNCEIDLQPEPEILPEETAALDLPHASLMSRILASLLDFFLILAIALALLGFILAVIAITGVDSLLYEDMTLFAYLGTLTCITIFYFVVMDGGASKSTFGKRWLNLALSQSSGNALGYGRSALRLILKICLLPLFPLLLIQPFTPQKQTLHDMLANSVVKRTADTKKVSVMAPLLVLFIALMVPVTALMATAGIPLFVQYIQQVQLNKGIKIGGMVSSGVERYYRINGYLPATLEETRTPVKSPLISNIEINRQNGEITLTFDIEARKNLRGKHLLFTPALKPDQRLEWKCHSDDIERYLLPKNCI